MLTLESYDNMMVDTTIAQGTAKNGTGAGDDPNPVVAEVLRGSTFTWVAKRTKTGWQIHINNNPMPVRNMTMIRKLVPCTEDALTYYSYI